MPEPRISIQPVPLHAAQPTAAADAALHVHLGGRLGEREERRAEARARRAEESLGEPIQRRLEIDEADAFVDAEPFDLRERRRVRRVEEVAAIHVAGNEHADRRRVRLQRADLHRRRVRAQQAAALEVERVVRVERRVVRREVQRAEVVPLRLGLGAEGDGEAELAEDRLDLLDDERDGMLGAAPLAPRRQREIVAAARRRARDRATSCARRAATRVACAPR